MTRILIADDNIQNLLLLEKILKRRGYEVTTAQNGAEALDLAQSGRPDLIVTDILMPVMDGFELCRRWKADVRLRDIPLVFYTSTYTDPQDERFALSLGADRFVVKPQRSEVLLQVVCEALEEREKGMLVASTEPLGDEIEVLRQYKDVLFRKLEKKVLQLEHEIAERKQTEKERLQLYEQAERDSQTKAELLREVNHRVKNNLITILGLLLTEQRHAPIEGRRFVQTAMDNLAHRIEGLLEVHNLLSESQWGPMRLSDLAARIIHVVTNAAPRDRRIVVEVHPSAVEVSPRQANSLALVFNELATNTIKYALSVRNRVRIAVQLLPEDEMIRIEYRDDGPGYPQEVLRQERESVGIHLIQRLVTETLRGRLALASENGAVTTMHIKAEDTART
jgi:two-component sensor histidine kinase/FixJ family two-component response regulator